MKWLIAGVIGLGLLFPTVADARKLYWSGTTWTVRHTYGPSNPGHNTFADGKRSAWVDNQNRLVLNIDKGRAVEIIGPYTDYGTFTWSVDSDLSNLDLWRVIGLFIWVPDGNEQDIEFARWGAPNEPTGWSVGWTRHVRTSFTNFSVTSHTPYTVRLIWTPLSTHYVIVDSIGGVLIDVSYPQLFPNTLNNTESQPRMNYWLWPGVDGVRLSKHRRFNVHPVLRFNSFNFTPLS